MLMRPLIKATAMNACQHAASASRSSDEAAGRCPGRAEPIKAINPRFRSTDLGTADPGRLRVEPRAAVALTFYPAILSILPCLGVCPVNRLPADVGDFLGSPRGKAKNSPTPAGNL